MIKQRFIIALFGLFLASSTFSFPLSSLADEEDFVMDLRPGSKPAPIPPNSPAGKGLTFNPNSVKRFVDEDLGLSDDDLVMDLRAGSKPAPIPPNSPAGKGLTFNPNSKRLVNDDEEELYSIENTDDLEDFDKENDEDLVMELRPEAKPAPIPPASKVLNNLKKLAEPLN